MTDLSADVRIVAEWLEWKQYPNGDWYDPPTGQSIAPGHIGWFIFTARILDKLPTCNIDKHPDGSYTVTVWDEANPYGSGGRVPELIDALVRATAAWRRAEGGNDGD